MWSGVGLGDNLLSGVECRLPCFFLREEEEEEEEDEEEGEVGFTMVDTCMTGISLRL